ncbi:PiggyBac transposable element-derived protein 4, partial [Stegodyphus mimosarum]
MVKFKGCSSFKQYMPKKPIKRGYKIWMQCDESTYACQFEIYTGKIGDTTEKKLSDRVVRSLPIFGKNHRLFMDKYFTSYGFTVFRFFETQKIFACGTVNMNRTNLPKKLKIREIDKRGEFDWASSEANIICLRWKDKNCVRILSCLENATNVINVERKERNDDILILIASASEEQHRIHLKLVFDDYGFRINISKSIFGTQEIEFLGYLITPQRS